MILETNPIDSVYSKMELYQLQYFVAIAENGSFTKAADTLYVTQPSLSAGIKKLEQELGVSLLERRWRGVRVTSAGELFLEKAQSIIREYQSTINAIRNFQERPILRLGMLCTLQVKMVSKIMQSFRELYPEVTVELHDTHLDELSIWLEQGEIDIAFTTLAPNVSPKTTHLLFQQRLLLGVPNAHPFARKKEVMLTELEDQPFIDRVKCEILTKQSPPIFEAMGVHPHIVYRADHEEWVISLIQSGLGMSIMPEWDEIEGITYVPLAKMQPVRQIGLEWHEKQSLELVKLFHSFVVQGTWFDDRFTKGVSP
ncbi:LysR family transcriptional regulator [Acaryochloris marina]|uniref:LysR family transcriptional regulator n=1 Tax=Acaryochloris marina TaxID=155978 RepID=UPI0021C47DF5|nr:LysR family transcriptional regulator [Acaryochloris marina]BDM83305.1 LysR family transcriptional regulator [Acaryochloris marina MBIC10699]